MRLILLLGKNFTSRFAAVCTAAMTSPIEPTTNPKWIPRLAMELWAHRELLKQFAVRNIELRHKGSYLGVVWAVLNPLLSLAMYFFIFGYVLGGHFRVNETRGEYALALLLGLAIFSFVSEALNSGPPLVIGSPNLVKKVVFPLTILPIASLGAPFLHLVISLCLVMIGAATIGPGLPPSAVWLFLIVPPLVPLAIGLICFFSALGVFFRDIGQVIGPLSMGFMFCSAVFYSAQSLPSHAWKILRFNPVLLAIEMGRDAVMWREPVHLPHLLYLWISACLVGALGMLFYRKLSPAFSDVL